MAKKKKKTVKKKTLVSKKKTLTKKKLTKKKSILKSSKSIKSKIIKKPKKTLAKKESKKAIIKKLPQLIKQKKIDFVIVNGENAADAGVGITKKNAEEFFNAGTDVITTGNHVWDQKETMQFILSEKRLLRPQNLIKGSPGEGFGIFRPQIWILCQKPCIWLPGKAWKPEICSEQNTRELHPSRLILFLKKSSEVQKY